MKKYPNIILVSGNGRNIGKTQLTCRIISNLASTTEVYAVKISPHFHELDDRAEVIVNNDNFCIVKETLKTKKDSSRMMMAGAKEAFYVQCKNENLLDMFEVLQSYLPTNKPVIIESGGLYNVIEPCGMYYIKDEASTKEHDIRDGENKIILSPNEATELNVENVFIC